MANRVFEDRVGLWLVDGARGVARLPAIKAYGGGLIVDVFFPRSSTAAQLGAARSAGFSAHLWTAVDGRAAAQYADDTLEDLARLRAGAAELNIELAHDDELGRYILEVVTRIRAVRPSLRMRINVGAWKASGLPRLALEGDPHLYACMQTYLGAMEPVSAGDCYHELLGYGVPESKLTLCYGAAGPVPPNGERVCTLPSLARRRRGVIFHDDLMADVGLL